MSQDINEQLIETKVRAAAVEAGIVDTALLSLVTLDPMLLKVNEKGQVEGVKEYIDLLKKAKPQFFKVADVRKLSDADYAKEKRRLLTGG